MYGSKDIVKLIKDESEDAVFKKPTVKKKANKKAVELVPENDQNNNQSNRKEYENFSIE